MFGRTEYTMLMVSFTLLSSYLILDKEEPVIMSRLPKDAIPLLDPNTKDMIQVNFMFPHIDAGFNHLLIQTTGPVLRCNYDLPQDLSELSHIIFRNPNYNFTTFPCIEVEQEISLYGVDAEIRKAAEFYLDVDFLKKHPNTFYGPARSRLVQLNTADTKGICVENDEKKTCLASLHLTDFNFEVSPATPLKPKRWKGSTQDVMSSLQMMQRDQAKSAEEACKLSQKAGVERYSMRECMIRTKFAVSETMRSIDELIQKTNNDPNRLVSNNKMVLFAYDTKKSSVSVNEAKKGAEAKLRRA